jgi:DHA2 family multidrug resistance protein-like MFS transporter
VNQSVENQLTKSFAGAESVAQQFPQYAGQITAAAKQSFLDGDDWAYTAGLIAVLAGAALVLFLFPKKQEEQELLAQYAAEDAPREEERPRAIA